MEVTGTHEETAMYATVVRRSSVVLSAVLLLLAAPAAHAQGPPKGDNLASPARLKVNASKTIRNIQFATVNDGASENTTCGTGTNSVWYRFFIDNYTTVSIDSGGSILNKDEQASSYVVLSLHRDVGGTLTEVDCVSTTFARLTDLSLQPGTYFVRIAGAIGAPLVGPSQYRVSVRARSISDILYDASFEEQPLGVIWKAKKAGTPAKITRECPSQCHVRFDGIAGGKLQQKLGADQNIRYRPGDLVNANAFILGTAVAGANIELTLKIAYTDGTPTTKVSAVRHFINTSTVMNTGFGSIFAEIDSKAVKSIKFSIVSPAASDTFSVTSTFAGIYAGSLRDAVLPPPAQ
jgi:hypothetical protein